MQLRDGLGELKMFPKPLSAEFLAAVDTWLAQADDDDLAEVKRELYGVEAHEDTRTVVRLLRPLVFRLVSNICNPVAVGIRVLRAACCVACAIRRVDRCCGLWMTMARTRGTRGVGAERAAGWRC